VCVIVEGVVVVEFGCLFVGVGGLGQPSFDLEGNNCICKGAGCGAALFDSACVSCIDGSFSKERDFVCV
jgi:hypothetical protein